jgi:UDP-N-acetyl-D-galactosamine dehydrogenase
MSNIYQKLINKETKLAVIGLGYVGLPIALEFAKKINAEFMADDYFFVQMRYDQLQQAKESDTMILDHTVDKARPDESPFGREKKFGTVKKPLVAYSLIYDFILLYKKYYIYYLFYLNNYSAILLRIYCKCLI